MTSFSFDIVLQASLTVQASSEDEARKILFDSLDCVTANLGSWPDGKPIIAEVSMDGSGCLYEVDGQSV